VTTDAAFRGLTFLVVDDDEETRDGLAALLEYQGAAVLLAADGDEALGCLRVVRPDLVITDVNMPARDGIALLRAIRDTDTTTRLPVIAVTGVADLADSMWSAGFDEVLLKPVQAEALKRVVRSLTTEPVSPVSALPIELESPRPILRANR
jgi:CheY-like chemotaxis protein